MKFVLSLVATVSLLGCASAPAPVSLMHSSVSLPWSFSAAENLKPQLCHTQLTDLDEAIQNHRFQDSQFTRVQRLSVYGFRMALRQKISAWTLQDPELSAECISLSAQIQLQLISVEERMAQSIYKNKKTVFVEQNVFMNSDEQLLSNSYTSDGVPVTSVSDLKNGDLVQVTTVNDGQESTHWSILSKGENGILFILTPMGSSSWLRRSVHHPLSWLKQPANRVVIFRPINEQTIQSVLQRILPNVRQNESFLHQQRTPASSVEVISALFPNKAQVDPALDPQFVQILQWQNHTK